MSDKRSLDQNAIFHAICDDIAKSGMKWAGKPRPADAWKVLLISGHAKATQLFEPEIVEGIEGELVNIRESSAKMSKERATSLIEYAICFCADMQIPLHDPKILAYEKIRAA